MRVYIICKFYTKSVTAIAIVNMVANWAQGAYLLLNWARSKTGEFWKCLHIYDSHNLLAITDNKIYYYYFALVIRIY